MTVLVLILMIGAAARLTRLVTRDSIAAPVRDHIETWETKRHDGPPPTISLTTLVNCPHCTGFWAAVIVGLGKILLPRKLWIFGTAVLTAAEGSSLIWVWEGKD